MTIQELKEQIFSTPKPKHWRKGLILCQKGKHKLRVNKMGVTWCVRCGLLSNTPNAETLQQDDKITIV